MIMIGDALGVAPEDRDDLLRWSDDMVSALSGSSSSEEAIMKAATAFAEYSAYGERVIAERRANPGTTDLMGILVDAEVDGDQLDDLELIHESLLILVGGDETTRHVISGGMKELITHPDERDALVADPALLPSAVEEMLRWVSPIRNMARTVTTDVELGGQPLARARSCCCSTRRPTATRRSSTTPSASTSAARPTITWPSASAPTSASARRSPASRSAVMVERLMTRLPDLTVAGDTPLRPANFVSGYESMPVTFTPTAKVGAGPV